LVQIGSIGTQLRCNSAQSVGRYALVSGRLADPFRSKDVFAVALTIRP